ncbi:MAG: prepilin peptidase [Candidatus Aminicenantes bacterium]|nr:prepilin peptidase [Candidatus Aminicenantes bacterium]
MDETLIIVVLFGLVWGSFLNVVIYRLPAGKNIVFPPSACPRCSAKIRPYDNIPVLSFILLGGRCRRCRAPIPVIYFLVELLTPFLFVLLYRSFSLTFHFLTACLFVSAMIVLAFIDLKHQILPDTVTLPGIVLAVAYAAFRPDLSLRSALTASVGGAAFLLLIYWGYYLLRRREGLGMGDVTMIILIGAYLGPVLTVLTLILASFIGSIVGAFVLFFGKKDLQFALPFGSFLAPAALVALLWGPPLINWYMALFQIPGPTF